ncbi:hypothetical protein DIC82_15040 [Clostridium beijerinckii]|nr:hypothetical protein DIC82_15040 [Clostridium beijerinckii]
MKYTIEGFSQQTLIDFNLDEKDALILRYFIDFKDSGNMTIKIIDDKPFYWLKSAALLKDLPILKIKSNDVLKRRLNKLIECKVLEHEHVLKGGSYSFYAVGESYHKLITTDTTQKSEEYDSKVGGGTTQKSEGYDSKVGAKNPSTKNPSTKNIISCGTGQPDSTVPYELIINMFNSTCKSLPRVKARNKTRDKHIKTIFRSLGINKIKELFIMTESSDYLSGRSGKWPNCGFDWIIKESNYIKVLEGNYNRQRGNVIPITSKAKETHEASEIEINKELLGDL